MGAYDSNPRRDPYAGGLRPPADGDPAIRILADRFADDGTAGDTASSNDSLLQVRRAVEDAENAIQQQWEENNQLRDELMRKTQELEKYKLEAMPLRPSSDVLRDEHTMGSHKNHFSILQVGKEDGNRWMDNGSSGNAQRTLVIHQNGMPQGDDPSLRSSTGNQQFSDSSKVNGNVKIISGPQTGVDTTGHSQFSSPSSRSLSPSRHRKEGEYDPRFNIPGHGLVPVSELNANHPWKQDLIVKVRENEEEIAQLKKHLADYSIKEAQIRNEKYVLEKRIAYMRMAFDQQQQDLVDAASKALSYRQDIIEENIRLTYALQAAQQERSTFVSSLLPLLSEYGLQPSVLDAQSIVSNLKVLFKHLQEKLILSEEKVKESQYQLSPWLAEPSNDTTFPPQTLPRSLGGKLVTSNANSLEIVAQPAYAPAQSPNSSPSNAQTRADWDTLGNQNHISGPTGISTNNPDHDNLERTPPSIGRNFAAHYSSAQVSQGDSHAVRLAETKNQNPSFKDLVRGNEMDNSETAGLPHEREPSSHWGSGSSPYIPTGLDDPNSSYPYLPPVLEEPGSSFSEAAEDDPLPAIEGLQISGEAFPGRELQACGFSINGTTSCNFEWVRYMEDGSVKYIEGAKQPKYLVTADDVDSYLAIEVQPLDNRKRKGELVKVYANEQRKITCDPDMQEHIERTLSVGQVSFEVSLSAGFLEIWEHAILAIKREGYSIKCNGPRGVVVTEKFAQATTISIPYGQPTELIIQCASGDEYTLRADENSSFRDTIVLTMRLFKMRVCRIGHCRTMLSLYCLGPAACCWCIINLSPVVGPGYLTIKEVPQSRKQVQHSDS